MLTWTIGGKLLGNETIVQHGLDLVDGCLKTYENSPYVFNTPSAATCPDRVLSTGIGPEGFAFKSAKGTYTGKSLSSDDSTFYDQHGWYVFNGASYYDLRPEVMESNFYAYRVTGDTKYLDHAARFIESIQKYLAAGSAYAPLQDIRDPNSGFFDDTESFFFAEVLKYLCVLLTLCA